jgi:hypothetical protein
LAEEDKLRPLVDESGFDLATAAEAYRWLKSADPIGKVVLQVAGTAP